MTTLEIAPLGDVILEVDEERIRVSSEAMSLASPVFEAMLNRRWVPSGMTSSNPHILPLPEDDLATTIYFCNVFHLRRATIPTSVISKDANRADDDSQDFGSEDVDGEDAEIACLYKLAVFYDKYKCTAALDSQVEVLLAQLGRSLRIDKLDKLLLIAFILDAPMAFSVISWKLLAAEKEPATKLPIFMDHPAMKNHSKVLLGKPMC